MSLQHKCNNNQPNPIVPVDNTPVCRLISPPKPGHKWSYKIHSRVPQRKAPAAEICWRLIASTHLPVRLFFHSNPRGKVPNLGPTDRGNLHQLVPTFLAEAVPSLLLNVSPSTRPVAIVGMSRRGEARSRLLFFLLSFHHTHTLSSHLIPSIHFTSRLDKVFLSLRKVAWLIILLVSTLFEE